jgi:hypothetical protein
MIAEASIGIIPAGIIVAAVVVPWLAFRVIREWWHHRQGTGEQRLVYPRHHVHPVDFYAVDAYPYDQDANGNSVLRQRD